MNTKNDAAVAVLAIIGAFVLIPVIAVFEGWALTEVWRLLLIPSAMDYAEVAIKPLSIGVAIAIAFTIRSFMSTGKDADTAANKDKGAGLIFVTALARPFLTVLFAWVLSLFIFGGQ